MNRLVQGDVGSGKTMVAAAAAYLAAKNGDQTALMAPTEILAEQHCQSLSRLFEPLGLRVALLTGSMTDKQKHQTRETIALGTVDLVVGTHALITDSTVFHKLGMVIADEQHRFGVAQRSKLAAKGEDPHVLVMSATPIPRTLALIMYGDLDVSVLDELPPGRQKVDTFLVGESYRARINAFIRKQVAEGHQCFVVCPAVEETEDLGIRAAETWAETLQKTVFPDLRVLLGTKLCTLDYTSQYLRQCTVRIMEQTSEVIVFYIYASLNATPSQVEALCVLSVADIETPEDREENNNNTPSTPDHDNDYGSVLPCTACKGSGNCSKCGGDGKIWSSASGEENRNCTKCNGSGRCTTCNGSGNRYN